MNQLVPVASATLPALVAAPAGVPVCGSSNFSPGKSLSGKEHHAPKRRKSAVVPTKSILKTAM